jgi:putative transposase
MDFTADTLADGRHFRTLPSWTTSRVNVSRSKWIGRCRVCVTRVLDRLAAAVGLPQTIVVDNGPEFAGRAHVGTCRARIRGR